MQKRSLQREAEIAMLVTSGLTLQEIADAIGLSREWVRQLAARGGVRSGYPSGRRNVDPLAIAQCAQDRLTVSEAADRCRVSVHTIYRVSRALNLRFRDPRKDTAGKKKKAERRAMIVTIRQFYTERCRSPSHREVGVAMGKDWPPGGNNATRATVWMALLWGRPDSTSRATRSRSYARYCHRAYRVAGVPVRDQYSSPRWVR